MRSTTPDGKFGLVVERTSLARFFIFQVILDGRTLGDREPCIIGSAMHQLRNLPIIHLNIPPDETVAASLVKVTLKENDAWYDATLLPLAESLDGVNLRALRSDAEAVFLIQSHRTSDLPGPPTLVTVPLASFNAVLIDIEAYIALQ